MPWRDFRHYLQGLETAGQLRRITKPVQPRFEVAAYIRKSSDTLGPAFLFDHVVGHEGWTVAGGLFNTYDRLTVALECPMDKVVDRYGAAVRQGIPPRRASDAPVKEVVLTGDAVDCTKLPVLTHSEHDAGPYITAAVLMGRDPDTGVLGLGIQRMQLKGPRRFGISLPRERRVARAALKAEDRGEPLGVAFVLGAGPYVDLASQAKIPHTQPKLDVAGGLAGRSIDVVPAQTVDVDVPADAEIVIEGHLLPHVREPEGPFGEVGGTYGLRDDRHVFEVSAITMRRKPIYPAVLTGMPTTDNHVMAWPAVCDSIRRLAQQGCPEVIDVHAIGPYYIAIVSIRKRLEGEGRNVILSVLGATGAAPQAKYCIVVDPDINVRDTDQVLWALYTRVQPDHDAMIFPVMVGAPLDPSAPMYRHSSKMGFDATVPLGAERENYARVVVPGTKDVTW